MDLQNKIILVTGCAGFIGSHTCEYLLKNTNSKIIGLDNMNDYYDVKIKQRNIELLEVFTNFSFVKGDIRNTNLIENEKPEIIIHLASMAGVRYSIKNPSLYESVNINGFIHILEEARKNNVKHIVYASSSSVYGLNKKVPFSETDDLKQCNSPYACSKLCMENYAQCYAQLYNMSLIGLRFFTVYGPRGRPDMAPYKFMKAIHEGTPLTKYGDGTTSRDYTYIDDIVTGVVSSCQHCEAGESKIYNLGNKTPISLNEFIKTCEEVIGKKANIERYEMQLGDVPHTCADITKAQKELGYSPKTSLKEGLTFFYKEQFLLTK